jgi:CubicO group peptidase (beta-lactamase class C family)
MSPTRRRSAVLLACLLLPLASAACSSSHPGYVGDGPDAQADAPVDAAPDPFAEPPIDARYAEFAAAFDQERVELGAPAAAVALIEHGKVTFAHGFGMRDPEAGLPAHARTLFRIGSTTKVLTATLVLQQIAKGKLDLAAKVKDVEPALAIDGPELDALTVRHLLTHSSGLFDYGPVASPASLQGDDAMAKFLTSAEYRANEYFMDPPGSMWNYSNPNFYIAGLMAERASGRSYRAMLTDDLLIPLGMTRTFLLPSEVLAAGDYAIGKSTDAGKPWIIRPDTYDDGWVRPAGFAFSSVLDFAKFVEFLYAGNPAVLPDAQRLAITTPQIDTLELAHLVHYGFATFLYDGLSLAANDYRATKVVTHGGDVPGFAADFWLIPETGMGAVVYASADGAHFGKSLVKAIASFGGLGAPTTRPDITLDPSAYDAFTGEYLESHQVTLVQIAKSGADLTISMPFLDGASVDYDRKLAAVGGDSFILTIAGTQMLATFVRDASGTPIWFRTRGFVAARAGTTTGATPSAMRAPTFDREAFLRSLRAAEPLPWPLRRPLAR